MVNDFTGGSFMETNYHSQFDNDGFYDEDVYRMHHELFGLLRWRLTVRLLFRWIFPEYSEKQGSGWTANGVKKPARTDNGCCGCWSRRRRRRNSCMQR